MSGDIQEMVGEALGDVPGHPEVLGGALEDVRGHPTGFRCLQPTGVSTSAATETSRMSLAEMAIRPSLRHGAFSFG
jgi:hypothetical protein